MTMAEFNPILRNVKRPTYLNSIKAMCAHCMGCTETHIEPGFRESIRACSDRRCPLYAYRPYRDSESLEARRD